jgi:hypothetical protein
MKYLNYLFFTCFLFLEAGLNAQMHDNFFYSGYGTGYFSPNNDDGGLSILDFTDSDLKVYDNQDWMMELNGNANCYSDSLGNLRLLFNGNYFKNGAGNYFPNGDWYDEE